MNNCIWITLGFWVQPEQNNPHWPWSLACSPCAINQPRFSTCANGQEHTQKTPLKHISTHGKNRLPKNPIFNNIPSCCDVLMCSTYEHANQMCLQPAGHTRRSFWLYFRVTDGNVCMSQSLWVGREGWWFAGKNSTAGATFIHLPLGKRGPQNYFNSGPDPFVSIIIICLGLQKPSALPWSCTLMSSNGTPIHWNPDLLSFSPEGKLYCRAIKEK